MIIPGSQDFTGYIGSTFDTVITVYPSADASFIWDGAWQLGTNYSINNVVIGGDNKAYDAIKANINVNPVGDVTGSWSTPLTPMNLNGWSGTIVIAPIGVNELTQSPLISTPVVIQGISGTIGIKFAASQSTSFQPGTFHHWVTMNDGIGDIYYFLNGNFIWDSP